ncbi:MAG: capsule biosynthesis protein CapC, partial [Neisseriaceae bacterium]|nr:capsule biosynthesis protein CapC [Neisseriaceae bacterium]
MKYRKVVKFFKKPHLFTRDFLNKRFPIGSYELPLPTQNEQAVMDFCEFVEETTLNNGYDFPIDVVSTWAGTKGVEKAAQFSGSQENISNYATDPMRFLDNNELQYAVTAVLCNMLWVRKIYIVSDGEVPDFIKKLS